MSIASDFTTGFWALFCYSQQLRFSISVEVDLHFIWQAPKRYNYVDINMNFTPSKILSYVIKGPSVFTTMSFNVTAATAGD